jgi:hypothetical protein
MTNGEDFPRMDIELLAQGCADSTRKYFRQVAFEPGYCFELMCRACRDGLEAALRHVYAIYIPLLAGRAKRHSGFPQTCQDANYFARVALANFYHAVKGEKFLLKFASLAQVIAYMYACVNTAVLADIDDNPPEESAMDENIPSPATPSELELQEDWSYIRSILPDEKDRLLTYSRFVLDMKPAEIAEQYRQFWETPRHVSVALQTIRRRLRADPYLRRMAGFSDETDEDADSEEGDMNNGEDE